MKRSDGIMLYENTNMQTISRMSSAPTTKTEPRRQKTNNVDSDQV